MYPSISLYLCAQDIVLLLRFEKSLPAPATFPFDRIIRVGVFPRCQCEKITFSQYQNQRLQKGFVGRHSRLNPASRKNSSSGLGSRPRIWNVFLSKHSGVYCVGNGAKTLFIWMDRRVEYSLLRECGKIGGTLSEILSRLILALSSMPRCRHSSLVRLRRYR